MVLAEDLRKAVLQYAVEGKMTKQLPTDSDVDELITRIKKEKAELETRKKARKEALYPEISDDEKEFEIPDNWRWIRLGEIGVYKKGPFGSALTKSIFVPKGEDTVKVYEQKNAIQKDASLGEYYITREYYDDKMSGFTLESGDIIVSCAGTIGETYIMPENIELGIINQALMRMNIADSINTDYFLLYFDHILKKNAKKSSNGSAIKNIPPFEVFKKMLLPLPPVEEQIRIVNRIKEVMVEIDSFYEIETQLAKLKEKFPPEMKASIIQYAIQGKLTKKLDTDSSIDEILNNLVFDKKLPDIGEEEIPCEIPEHWRWVRLGNLGESADTQSFSDGPFGSNLKKEHQIKEPEVRIIQLSNIGETGWKDDNVKYTSFEHLKTIERCEIHPGDLVVAKMMPAGRTVEVPDLGTKIVLGSDACKFVPNHILNKDYLKYAMKSKAFLWQVYSEAHGITRVRTSLTKLKSYIIPIPPIEEQQRIVDKLNQILPLCDDLNV